jgi:hypothetical protein
MSRGLDLITTTTLICDPPGASPFGPHFLRLERMVNQILALSHNRVYIGYELRQIGAGLDGLCKVEPERSGT